MARALITGPQIILADEPTGALDSRASDTLLQLFEDINEEGQTILMVTHNEAIAQTCDRVIHIEDGCIVTGKRNIPVKGGDGVC